MEKNKGERTSGWRWLMGLAVGFLNGLFGAGGGIVAVPMLQRLGLEKQESHATAMVIVLPLAVVSGGLYLREGLFHLRDALPFLPGGLAGALAGAWLLPRIKTQWLHRLFGAVILLAAGRLLLG